MKTILHSLILALALSAHGQGFVEAIAELSSPGGTTDDGTIGFAFRANAELTITELGVFAQMLEKVGPINIGMWDEAGNLKASALVTGTSPLIGLTRYETLTSPISLAAQQVYYVGALIPQATGVSYGGGYFGGGGTITPGIQYLGLARADGTTTLTKPTPQAGWEEIIPATANFIIQGAPVPEPSAALLLLCGGLFCWFFRGSR